LCCTEQRRRQRQSGRCGRNRANELTTRHGGIICGRVAPVGLGCRRCGVAKEFSKRCVRHNGIGVSRCECIVLREGLQCGFARASPFSVIESSVRIFRCRVQEENTLLPVTRS
jgi:hypothetical protein